MLIFDDLSKIITVLEEGGIIIYPTDTIWGIGCDAFNENAIKKIYSIKEREPDKPFIVLVSDLDMLKRYVGTIHPRIESLLFYHEKPVTVIYRNVPGFPSVLYGEKKSVAVRVVKDKYCQEFIHTFGKPVVSTSVNRSGEEAPQHFKDIHPDLLSQADFVSNYRRNDHTPAKASAIVSFNSSGKLKFLR